MRPEKFSDRMGFDRVLAGSVANSAACRHRHCVRNDTARLFEI
jgi:hypothetical protein